MCENIETSFQNSKKATITHDTDSAEMFNFGTEVPLGKTDDTTKKLMFAKPLKRRNESAANDDDLFNSIPDKKNKENNVLTHSVENYPHSLTNKNAENDFDVVAMRGIKLKELNNDQAPDNFMHGIGINRIKKEYKADLEPKSSEPDMGTTVIIVKKDLIIKKEPLNIDNFHSTVKNFKKFIKVWPVKMKVSIASK